MPGRSRTSECVLAVDIGTQSTRAALVDYGGHIVGTATSPIDLFTPRPGWAEQDPAQWWATTLENIATVVSRHPAMDVVAIGVGAQMHGVVALDAEGKSLGGRSAIWSDKRCAEQVGEFQARRDAGSLAALAANRPLPAWAGFKMAWLRQHVPDAYAGAAKLLVVKDFVNQRLCGEMATDHSEASGSFLYDVSTGQWSGELMGALGVERSKLPEIVGSSAVIGGLRSDLAGKTGLLGGTPVVAGSGDMMCQLLGTGLTDSGRVALVAGTASILALAADSPSPDLRVMNLRTASGNWARFGLADAAGVSLAWFVDQFCAGAGEPGRRRAPSTGSPRRRLPSRPGRVGSFSSPTFSASARWGPSGPGLRSSGPLWVISALISSVPCSKG